MTGTTPGWTAARARRSKSWETLLDRSLCPACGSTLTGPRCTGCGVDLTGEPGRRLWQLSESAADTLAQREALLTRLEQDVAARFAGAPMPMLMPSTPAMPPMSPPPMTMTPTLPSPRPSGPIRVPAPPRSTLVSRIGVQGLLVGVGALMIAVAGVVFLVFSWDRLSLGARAAVIAGITAAAMGAAAWLRPRLPETAEAIGAIGAVLVLADAWAVRATGLFGADRVDGAGYGALAGLGCAAILLGWARLGRVRAGSVTACLVGPMAVLSAGVWLGRSNLVTPDLFAVELGLLGAALLAAGRRLMPPAWTGERAQLRLIAAPALVLAVLLTAGLTDRQGSATLVLGLATLISGLQAAVDARADRRIRVGWSVLCGATAVATAVPAASGVLAVAGVDQYWMFAAAPTSAAALALLVDRFAGRAGLAHALLHRAGTSAARSVALAVGVPSAAVAGFLASATAAGSLYPWRARSADHLSMVLANALQSGEASRQRTVLIAAAAGLGLAGFALLLAASRPARWTVAVAAAGGLALVGLPLSPAQPLIVVIVLLLLVAVGAAVFAVFAGRLVGGGPFRAGYAVPAGLTVSAVAGTQAVLLSWTVRELSVPLTLVGVVGLLIARRRLSAGLRPVLAPAAVLATAVAAAGAAGLLGARPADRLVVAALTGALIAAAVGGLPAGVAMPVLSCPGTPDTVARERFAGVLAGLLPGALTAVAALVHDSAGRLGLVLAGLLLAALAGAARPPLPSSPSGAVAPVALAAGLPLLAAGAAAATAAWIAAARPDRPAWALIGGSAAIAGCGLALGLIGARSAPAGLTGRADPRRRAAEVGALPPLAALAAGVIGGPDLSPAGAAGWWVLLLLGVGATAAAVPADRRRVGWLGWCLLTASSWYRLSGGQIGLLEAYTVPPALALIAVSAVRLRRDRSARAWSTLVPGLSLGLAPSVIAATHGTAIRPAVLIGSAAVAVLSARWTGRRLELLLMAAGVATAGSTAAVRSLAAAVELDRPGVLQLEVWSVSAAFVLVAAVVLLITGHRAQALRSHGWIGVPPLALVVVPSLLAASAAVTRLRLGSGESGTAQRAGAALAVAGAIAVAAAWLSRPHGAGPDGGEPDGVLAGVLAQVATVPLRRTALGLTLGAGLVGWWTDVGVAEVWTVPVAGVLLALGARRLVELPQERSWRALGAGLLVLLIPSLTLSISGADVWRIVAVPLVAGAVLVIGAVRRLQAPAVIGACTLVAHAAFQLGPWVARTVAGQPRWVVLGLVGALLLALGATYERRLSELRAVRLRLVALR